eukprot:TRINITY_DN12548_c0_g1_i1.p1 TRINITY_DN12548_c0_g1~~TRINITY_DN12548_c0_g1_i1.p1  ORF type:complete len:122 (+),score=25.93 TRINITY_DN12548_c0_g1_i1:114-479(+)
MEEYGLYECCEVIVEGSWAAGVVINKHNGGRYDVTLRDSAKCWVDGSSMRKVPNGDPGTKQSTSLPPSNVRYLSPCDYANKKSVHSAVVLRATPTTCTLAVHLPEGVRAIYVPSSEVALRI